ncbi:MAG: FHA domain-containing protein [Glaciecola sp.]
MLLPGQHQALLNNGQRQALENGISSALRSASVLQNTQIFSNCHLDWCEQPNRNVAVSKVHEHLPKVELVLVYDLVASQNKTSVVDQIVFSLIDPLSYKIHYSNTLVLAQTDLQTGLYGVGGNIAQQLNTALDDVRPVYDYGIHLIGFDSDELMGLSTFLLTNPYNNGLRLEKSTLRYLVLDQYLAVMDSHYIASSTLNASQFNSMIVRFFAVQNIDISVVYKRDNFEFVASRQGNPYAPSLITWLVVIIASLVLVAILARRHYLATQLVRFARQHNADAWLATYQKARLPVYGWAKKWRSHELYWQRLQRESTEFCNQAQVYYDAGDLITSKLFLSKALHTNCANEHALVLTQQIEHYEKHEKALSDTEQWIRNKIAKAMNNYRQQLPLKALRQLYQAHEKARNTKGLKKQSKAIKKLIKKMLIDTQVSAKAIVANSAKAINSVVVCEYETIHLGRLPSKTDVPWISSQDSVYYINHKQVSRVGQHCFISRHGHQFHLIDTGSKNGTYVNGQRVDVNIPVLLQHKDHIQLGDTHSLVTVSILVDISDNNEVMRLSFEPFSQALVDRRELNRMWPDNALAMRTQLCCITQQGLLILDEKQKHISIATNNKQNSHAICQVMLGDVAQISPIDGVEVMIDDVPLLGPVPLLFPCKLSVNGLLIQINEYNNASVRVSEPQLLSYPNAT